MCKPPDLPPPPTPIEPPKAANEAVTRAGERAGDKLRSNAGRRGTILSNASASTAGETAKKTLLGG